MAGWGRVEWVGMECVSKALLNGAGTPWGVAMVGPAWNMAEAVGLGPKLSVNHSVVLGLREKEEEAG
jgi:hypothetical protein